MANRQARGTLGNLSRTGMPKPPRSGRQNQLGDTTNITFRIGREDKAALDHFAASNGESTGATVRRLILAQLHQPHLYPQGDK
jgi:hypothetical protein